VAKKTFKGSTYLEELFPEERKPAPQNKAALEKVELTMLHINIRLPVKVKKYFKKAAHKAEMNMTQFLLELIKQHMLTCHGEGWQEAIEALDAIKEENA